MGSDAAKASTRLNNRTAKADKPQPAHPVGSDRERHLMVLTIRAQLKRTGIEMRLVVDDGSKPANVDPILVRLLVRAHAIRARLLQDPSLTLKEIAAEEGVVSSYVWRNGAAIPLISAAPAARRSSNRPNVRFWHLA